MYYLRNNKRQYDQLTSTAPAGMGAFRRFPEYASGENPAEVVTKVISDSISVSDAVLEFLGFKKVIDEIVNITEPAGQVILRILAFISETVQTVTGIYNPAGWLRVLADTLQITESKSKINGLIHAISEASNIAESIIDTLSAGITQITKLISESLSISDGRVKLRGLYRVIFESSSISETILGGLQNLLKLINDSINLSETNNKLRTMLRFINETERALEGSVRILVTGVTQLVRQIDETISVTTQNISSLAVKVVKIINENISISVSALRIGITVIVGYLKTSFNIVPAIKTALRIKKDND